MFLVSWKSTIQNNIKMNINFPGIFYCKNIFIWIHENCIYHFFSDVSHVGETNELPVTSTNLPICKQMKLNNHCFESVLPGIYIYTILFNYWWFKRNENLGVRNGVPDLKKTLPWNKLKSISNSNQEICIFRISDFPVLLERRVRWINYYRAKEEISFKLWKF